MRNVDMQLLEKLITSLKEAVLATGTDKVVLGLSGGIDSALSATLAVKALGRENVFPYSLPYKLSSQASKDDARLMADHLGITLETVDLTPMAEGYSGFAALTAHRLGNILARLRMLVLFDKSAEKNAVVLGSGNKSEILLGYMTLYGDSASAVNPVGELYNTQVFEAARLLGIPEPLITKAPSADLRPGQTDEDDLGYSYADLDRFLEVYIGQSADEAELTAKFGAKMTADVVTRVKANAYKRNLPTILSIN